MQAGHQVNTTFKVEIQLGIKPLREHRDVWRMKRPEVYGWIRKEWALSVCVGTQFVHTTSLKGYLVS